MTVLIFPGAHVTVDDPAASVCLIGRRPHPATDGLLCRHHLSELGGWLHDIQDETERLSAVPRMETRYDSGGGGLASHRAPVIVDVVAYLDGRTSPFAVIGPCCAGRECGHDSCEVIRSDRDGRGDRREIIVPALETLAYWANRARAERQLVEPPSKRRIITPLRGPGGVLLGEWSREVPCGPTLMSERLLLTRQLAWIAGRPWVAGMYRELGELRRQLLGVNRNADPKPLPGWCYRQVDGVECHGDLWPAEPLHTSGFESRDGIRAVVCSRHPDQHRWEGDDLPRLLVIVDEQRREETAS